ncbi:MAG: hypothetical protein ACOX2M_00150 [Fastidiosipilaceae bacterium]|jgi:hypothetical protein
MDKDALQSMSDYVKQRRQTRGWHKILTFLVAMVVFVTTYSLIGGADIFLDILGRLC